MQKIKKNKKYTISQTCTAIKPFLNNYILKKSLVTRLKKSLEPQNREACRTCRTHQEVQISTSFFITPGLPVLINWSTSQITTEIANYNQTIVAFIKWLIVVEQNKWSAANVPDKCEDKTTIPKQYYEDKSFSTYMETHE